MARPMQMGERRFGAVNWLGLATLCSREVRRFLSVWTQTILAPVATSGLFMLVFTLAFAARRGPTEGLPFEVFLAPGVLMMTVVQNAFANTSSSIMIAKIQGNIVDTLMPPLSAGEILTGYIAGGLVRGVVCALAIGIIIFPAVGATVEHPFWALWFLVAGSTILALAGLLAGIYASKFDQMAAITNFIVTPLAFLSGTFYSIQTLPEAFRVASHFNPIFYLIDGFRHATIGAGDSDPWIGFAVTLGLIVALWMVALHWIRRGYRLKS